MADDAGTYPMSLVAMLKDQDFITTINFKVVVRAAKGRKSRVNHQMSMTIDTDFDRFMASVQHKMDLAGKVRRVVLLLSKLLEWTNMERSAPGVSFVFLSPSAVPPIALSESVPWFFVCLFVCFSLLLLLFWGFVFWLLLLFAFIFCFLFLLLLLFLPLTSVVTVKQSPVVVELDNRPREQHNNHSFQFFIAIMHMGFSVLRIKHSPFVEKYVIATDTAAEQWMEQPNVWECKAACLLINALCWEITCTSSALFSRGDKW